MDVIISIIYIFGYNIIQNEIKEGCCVSQIPKDMGYPW